MRTIIFTSIDEERKMLSFAISEVIFAATLGIGGFVFNQMIVAISGLFCGVFIMRYIKAKLKKTGFSRKLFFITSDLFTAKQSKYYSKYYL